MAKPQERIESDETKAAFVEVEFLAAVYHADDEKATAADASKVRELLKTLPQRDRLELLRSDVEGALIRSCTPGRGSQVIVEQEIENMRKRFDYDNVSGVEKALIDRVVVCWLRLQNYELVRAGYDKGTHFVDHIEQAEKHLHMAHSRYLRSIEELAKVRFLMSRTNPVRLAAVRAALKGEDTPQQEPGKLLEMKAG